ncbi:hypothetical protein [Bacillus vallismortis]|uniref:hypothetical protein n=1 Tax=Bacillus vallismortis TaxID=72361 RepID=UPI002091CD9B|nr:hypothetical protein [Bacillus vallismortis]MCO4852580.1 hypothetical protein [Bacillus vallismortis]
MIVIILFIIAIIVFVSVVQPKPLENKSRQHADSGFFGGYSDHGSHHNGGCGSDGGFSDSGCGGGGDGGV